MASRRFAGRRERNQVEQYEQIDTTEKQAGKLARKQPKPIKNEEMIRIRQNNRNGPAINPGK